MVARIVVGFGALLLLLPMAVAAPKAAKQECPTLDKDEIEKLLKEAPSCDQSMKMFEVCSFGTSNDTDLGEIVSEKCEGDFVAKLSKAERKTYDGRRDQCQKKYANKSGSMYRSFSAFCAAKVSQDYSRKALKASAQKR